MPKAVVKVRRYPVESGATSVLHIVESMERAQALAAAYNIEYQTDTHYAEEWDDAKLVLPSRNLIREIIREALDKSLGK